MLRTQGTGSPVFQPNIFVISCSSKPCQFASDAREDGFALTPATFQTTICQPFKCADKWQKDIGFLPITMTNLNFIESIIVMKRVWIPFSCYRRSDKQTQYFLLAKLRRFGVIASDPPGLARVAICLQSTKGQEEVRSLITEACTPGTS